MYVKAPNRTSPPHREHASGILSGISMETPFLGLKRWRGFTAPAFKNKAMLIIKLNYQVRLMIHKPTDLFTMTSRDAVRIHVHPRSLLSAT